MPAFLSPLFLVGAAAAAIPIVLHLLRRDPEVRVKFAAVRLIASSPVEQAARRRLREYLLLALRIAALVLLSLAFARPFFAQQSSEPTGLTVVALDTSLSLSAPGRFDRAKQLAREAIGRAAAADRIAVVAFDDTARIVTMPTPDRALALSGIDAVTTGYGATRYRAALTAAADLINTHGGAGRIVVVSDLQQTGWDEGDQVSIPEAAVVEVVDVGPLAPNLAITAVRADTNGRVIATVSNRSPEMKRTRVRLRIDDQAAGEADVTIRPDQAVDVSLTGREGKSGSVSIEDAEGVQADNSRYIVLDGSGAPPVLVITGSGDLAREAFFVQQALQASNAAGGAYRAEALAAEQLATWNATRFDEYAAVIVMSTRGLDRRGRDVLANFVRAGGGLLVAIGPGVDGEVTGNMLENMAAIDVPQTPPAGAPRSGVVRLAPSDVRHPMLRRMGAGASALGLVAFRRVADVKSDDCTVLAHFTTGQPALLECSSAAGRSLVFASDFNDAWNDFPRHATFVPFLHEAVGYLDSGRRLAAEYYVGNAPAGAAAEPGIVTLLPPPGGRSGRAVAINIDPAEADSARLLNEQFLASVTHAPAGSLSRGPAGVREQEADQHIWRYVLLLMIAMLVCESVVGTRTA